MAAAARAAALAPMDVPGRLARARTALAEHGEALLVTKLVNIRWLTGFTGSAGLLLVLPDEMVLVTDGRYDVQAQEQLAASGAEARLAIGVTVAAQRDVLTEAAAGASRVALEADDVTWAQQRAFAAEWFPGAELVATEALLDELRAVKDAGEVARIEAAATIADAALAAMRHRLGEGLTEAEVGLELDTTIRRLGAEGTAFETIVASGPNGAKPHHRPGTRRIVPGDLVVLDFGALVDGYCSDMTRTVMVGEATPTQQRMLEVVRAAQQAGVEAVGPGVAAIDVDAACRRVIAEAGWADAFSHGTGHGLGLEIHELPRVGSTSSDVLHEGHVVTVEPGVYLPGHGGVRVEDTLLVTPTGARRLTLTPKDPTL